MNQITSSEDQKTYLDCCFLWSGWLLRRIGLSISLFKFTPVFEYLAPG